MAPNNQNSEQQPSISDPPIVVLCAGGALAWIMINALRQRFRSVVVLEEDPESKRLMMRRRAKLIGWSSVLGQVAFGIVLKGLHKISAARKAEIVEAKGLDPAPSDDVAWYAIGSVNSDTCRSALQRFRPAVVVVLGTRLIRRETFSCVNSPFINYHPGLNPKYRGMNGGYWALAEGDHAHAGVTIHLIDEGVDTGAILYTAAFEATDRDNIVTYYYLQAAAAVPLLMEAVEDALNGRLSSKTSTLPSRQWFHPTLWQYFRTGLSKGVW
jgi:folate-dependent phosphoribosylglycinamide formyltransferase PurN